MKCVVFLKMIGYFTWSYRYDFLLLDYVDFFLYFEEPYTYIFNNYLSLIPPRDLEINDLDRRTTK